jgi:N-glycosylase/DNA lyase
MTLLPAPDLNLSATLDSGQTFSFSAQEDGSFVGRLLGVPVRVSHEQGLLKVVCAPGRLTRERVSEYFDLDRNLTPVYDLLGADPLLKQGMERYRGLRLLKQDPWEATACFIISSNNNIKRIQLIWKRVADHYTGEGRFPSAEELACSDAGTLRKLGLGYRAEYLLGSAKRVAADPSGFMAIGNDPDMAKAKERLQEFEGVGPKVADCILLYGFHRLESFPIDVWIERVMKKLYFRNRRTPAAKIQRFAAKRWGAHAGYVQQYLFHSVRTGVIPA